jgi:translation initiation factor 3 subunit F
MSLNPASSSLHLALPSSSAQARTPTNITVHPAVIASILAHHSRQPDAAAAASGEGSSSGAAAPAQGRVLGALLGQRSENGAEVDVRNCYAVPHSEDESTVALDMPFQQSMAGLMSKLGAKEVIVGW